MHRLNGITLNVAIFLLVHPPLPSLILAPFVVTMRCPSDRLSIYELILSTEVSPHSLLCLRSQLLQDLCWVKAGSSQQGLC